jgi:hypothetical protein
MQRSASRLTSGILVCLLLTGLHGRAQVSFNLPANPGTVNITGAEYFFDTDPGLGKGTSLSVTAGNPITISNASIPVNSLANGSHHLFLRTEDANGHWSLTNAQTLFVVTPVTIASNPALVNITKAEYFFDTDPGLGKATAIPVTAGLNITVSNYAINVSSLTSGIHHLYLRAADAKGHWSITNVQSLYVVNSVIIPSNPGLVNITQAECFFDTDPGIGKGTALSVTPGLTTNINSVIPINSLSTGIHRLYLRTADANGHWSLTNESNLAILSTSLIIPSNPTPGNITLLEYFFDTDPGFGNGTPVVITGTTNLVNYTFPVDVSGLSDSNHYLFVRVLDDWSQSLAVGIHYGTPLPITLLSFTASLQSNRTVDLSWVTTNEVNNRYFAIQRSGNGADFDSIGTVAGAGTTDIEQHYSYTDAAPLQGVDYYRLKQVDLDGNTSWSPIVSVRIQASTVITLTPNPAHDLLTVSLGISASSKGAFRIVDMKGRIVQSVNATADNIQQLNIANLEAGAYILQYLTPFNSTTIPFIKF